MGIWEVDPIEFSSLVRPVCLPLPQRDFDLDRYEGDQVTLTGWGHLAINDPTRSPVLRKTVLQVYEQRWYFHINLSN